MISHISTSLNRMTLKLFRAWIVLKPLFGTSATKREDWRMFQKHQNIAFGLLTNALGHHRFLPFPGLNIGNWLNIVIYRDLPCCGNCGSNLDFRLWSLDCWYLNCCL